MITRDVYVTRRKRVEPISVVYGSDAVSIRLRVADFIIPSGAEAVANVVSLGRATAYQVQCTVEGGAISFTPPVGFFQPGVNRMQVDVTMAGKHLITFVLDVHCESNLVADMDTTTPEAVRPMVERAEVAASNAEAAATSASNAATRAEQAADSIRFSTNETLTLSSEKVLSVNTADSAVSGSGLPITSGAVYSLVGNVEAILQSI